MSAAGTSRRGIVKINPVTGELKRVEKDDTDGKKRDGSLLISEKYLNAAKDLGLGADAGMYSHIKSLARVGAADVPTTSSIQKEGEDKHHAKAADKPALDAKNTAAVADAIKTSVTQVGRAKVAGFGASKPASSIHNHEDAFQRRKGVVNTVSGAKDVTRKVEDAKLPPKGSKPAGPRVVSMDTIDTLGEEGRARREAQDKRAAIQARSSSVGGVQRSTTRALEGSGVHVQAPVKHAPKEVKVVGDVEAAPRRVASTNVLGGSGSAANTTGNDMAAKRAAFFEKKFAEEAAKKAAASARASSS